jgi:hypothetical protein
VFNRVKGLEPFKKSDSFPGERRAEFNGNPSLLNVIPFLVASITTENHFSPVWIIWVMTARIKPREDVIACRCVIRRRRFEVDT